MAATEMATSRVHRKPREPIELPIRRGERFTILSEEGDWWYIARNKNGEEGYIPAACLVVDSKDPSLLLYKAWRIDTDDLMKRGNITRAEWKHLAVPHRLISCSQLACRAWKSDNAAGDGNIRLGACIHDVESLLSAEPAYGADWLKTERLRWHPDRFRARCAENSRAVLGKRAEEMFTVLTKLYEAELLKEKAKQGVQTTKVPPPQGRSEPYRDQRSYDQARKTYTAASSSTRPSSNVKSPTTPNRHSLDPSATPFTPRSTPAAWTNFAKEANVREHDQKLADDPIGTFDKWNNASTLDKSKSEVRRPLTSTNDATQKSAYRKPRTDINTPDPVEPAWQETKDQRHQRLLVQARNIRAKAMKKLAEEERYHYEEEQRLMREEKEQEDAGREARRARRVRWGKQPLDLDERVAEQDLRDKRKANAEKMRAAAETRLKARLEAQQKKDEEWKDETADALTNESWGSGFDGGVVGTWDCGYGDCESGPATP